MTSVDQRVATVVKTKHLMYALGDNPRAVADKLNELGHRGTVASSACCPLAVYLSANLDVLRLAVVGDVVYLRFSESISDREIVEVPQPVEEFVALFDSGVFPELLPNPEVALTGGPA